MKKFSKILESKESILDSIGISEEEVKEICQDLIDEFDYKFSIQAQYISPGGHIYYKPDQSSEYYPSVLVSLKRELTNKDNGGAISKTDPRNWNGGIYYEDDSKLIKILYETITNLESMLDKGEIKVFYAIRGVDDIELRVTIATEKSKLPIDIEDIKYFIEEEIDELDMGDYKIQRTMSMGNKRSLEIIPKKGEFSNSIYDFDENDPCDNILKRAIIEGKSKPGEEMDNKSDLLRCANIFVKALIEACSESKNDNSIRGDKFGGKNWERSHCNISYGNQELIKIDSYLDDYKAGSVTIEKGLFKDKKVRVSVYKLELTITIIPED